MDSLIYEFCEFGISDGGFILEEGLLIILIDCIIFLLPSLDVTRMPVSTVSFLTQLYSGTLCLENVFL